MTTEIDKLRNVGNFQAAKQLIADQIALDPTNPAAWLLLADAAGRTGDFLQSKDAAFRAISYEPSLYGAWSWLANAHAGLGQWDAAGQAAERVLAIAQDMPFAHWLRAHARQFNGEWRESWKSYEYGFACAKRTPRCVGKEWDGSPIPGKVLFVYAEQGHGDAIQYARYLKLAKERSGAVIIAEWHKGLLGLMSHLSDVAIAMHPDRALTFNFDYHVPLMSLPHVLGLEGPDPEPYLSVEPDTRHSGKVGICWKCAKESQGNPQAPLWDLPPEMLDGFKDVQGMLGIQPGQPAPEWMEVPEITDWASSARVIAALDLVVTVDTGTVHLAGALGVPTILMAPLGFMESRWGRKETSDLYSSVQIVHGATWEETLSKTLAKISSMRSKSPRVSPCEIPVEKPSEDPAAPTD